MEDRVPELNGSMLQDKEFRTVEEVATGDKSIPAGSGNLQYLSARLKDFRQIFSLLPAEDDKPWEIFRVLGQSADELAHSSILAYLLDPLKPHGLNTLFLQAFLEKSKVNESLDLSDVRVSTEVVCRNRRADIVVDGPDWFLLIENKVLAHEGDGQTIEMEKLFKADSRYSDKTPYFVYLTPKGVAADNTSFEPVSYADVAGIVKAISLGEAAQLPHVTQFLLSQFIEHIEESICMTRTEWAKVSERSRLYVLYANEIEAVTKSFEDDIANIWVDWQNVVERTLGKGWVFPSLRGDFRQVHKPGWRRDGYYIHFEIFISRRHLTRRKIPFMLEVEKQGGSNYGPDEIISLFDADPGFQEAVEAIGSAYRPEHRRKALAYREYELGEDFSNLGEILIDSLEKHQVLVERVDAILARYPLQKNGQ